MRDRIKLLAPNVILYREVPRQTIQSLEVMFEQVFKLSHGLNAWYLIIDIRETTAPSLEVRDRLREIYAKAEGLRYVALITGMSRILGFFVRFVAGNSIKIPFSVVKDLDAAIKHIEAVKLLAEASHSVSFE